MLRTTTRPLPPQGVPATRVGSADVYELEGTEGPDVIVTNGSQEGGLGKDRVEGRSGRDACQGEKVRGGEIRPRL